MAKVSMEIELRFQAKAHEREGGEGWDLEVITTLTPPKGAPSRDQSWFGPFPTRAAALEQAHCIRTEMQRRIDAGIERTSPGSPPGQWFDFKKGGSA